MIDKLNSTLNAIFKDADFHKKWEALGTPVVGGTPAQFGELIKRDPVRLGKLVKDAGVTLFRNLLDASELELPSEGKYVFERLNTVTCLS